MERIIVFLALGFFLIGVALSLSVVFLFPPSKRQKEPAKYITPWGYDEKTEERSNRLFDYEVAFNHWKRNVNEEEHKPTMPHTYRQDMVDKALKNFSIEKKLYTLPGRKPLISIITRNMKARPKRLQMARNEHMVKAQLEYNFEQVWLTDEALKGSGMQIAEVACDAFKAHFDGDYICHIDDDDYFASVYFTKRMREIIDQKRYKVIVFKMWHEELNRTQPRDWKKFPSCLSWMSTNNWLMRKDVYKAHINVMSRGSQGADTRFIRNVLLDCQPDEVAWVNECFTVVPVDDLNHARTQVWSPHLVE